MLLTGLKEKYNTHFTQGNLNNHIGVPITLIRIEEGCEAVVCEMGMSGKGEIEYLTGLVRPNLAVITNIGTMHIEHLGSQEGILKAKMEIVEGMGNNGVLVLNGDDALLQTQRNATDKKVVYFGNQNQTNDVLGYHVKQEESVLSFDVKAENTDRRKATHLHVFSNVRHCKKTTPTNSPEPAFIRFFILLFARYILPLQ